MKNLSPMPDSKLTNGELDNICTHERNAIWDEELHTGPNLRGKQVSCWMQKQHCVECRKEFLVFIRGNTPWEKL